MNTNVMTVSNQVEPTEPAIKRVFVIISLWNISNYSLSSTVKYWTSATYTYSQSLERLLLLLQSSNSSIILLFSFISSINYENLE